ncbi:UNVERIFIED_ORG: AraC family transcriptional regulator [Clostridium botulinum]|uniref:helix-turn-helix domain-containing protein n=1 Tax=Clostridium TaxID=1485 RepID=UPI000376B072|nr:MULTISPECIES: AraC family transcriptional regulator [Clostridium]MBN1036934.1 AraC family transcriptional regulator [Clostridium botulinum]MBY6839066.1 helix-turn-helix transcriptional regulator [Clostridium botulinum]MCS6132315.1 AraC family transcriptional regulator [Clostridium botulinum]NFG65487.1 helix-turn-helix transcriptional regulator [Clostridium botulinum]NFH81272.1 helix-turn-helix transcriptional regulator [Clostridium botulinum]
METKEKNLLFIIENFYLCTSMPIRVVDSIGKTLLSKGNVEDSNEDFIYKHLLNLIYEKQNLKTNFQIVEYLDLNFAICPYLFNHHKFFFILGPFNKEKNENSKFIYRPLHCIPPLVQLLYNFDNNKISGKYNNTPLYKHEYIIRKIYSFHIKRALEYIHENYKKNITLDKIVSHVNINKSYFCSLFKKEIGKTCTQYINSLRIKESEELLLNTEMSLLDISLAVGFNNQNYYNNLFKKEHCISPLKFKNKHFS